MDGLPLLFNRSLCLGDRGASPHVQPVSPSPGTTLGQGLGNLTLGPVGTPALRGSPQPLPTLGRHTVEIGVRFGVFETCPLQPLILQTLIQKENPLWNS